MTPEMQNCRETIAALSMIEPGIMITQIGRYGMNHPPATQSFEYTRAIL